MLARKLMSRTQTIWEYHSVSSFSAIKVAGTLEQYNKCRITNNRYLKNNILLPDLKMEQDSELRC